MSKGIKKLLLFLAKLSGTALVVFLVLQFVVGVFVIHSNNMYPMVCDGDLLITNKLCTYYAGEVIAYQHNYDVFFGRVIAIEGDEIDINGDGYLYLNGIPAMETIYYETLPDEFSDISFPYIVREGEIFVLNDMRTNTTDSRVFGGIHKDDCLGSVVFMMRYRSF